MATISDFLLRVRVEGQQLVDKLITTTDKVDKNMNKVAKSSGNVKAALSDVGGALSNAASTGNAFADSLISAVGRLGLVASGAAVAAGAIGLLGLKAINAADAYADLSDATGISASKLLSLKQSIIAAGGDADDYAKIAAKLNQNIGEAANGSDAMREKFQKLGVALGDSNGKLRSTDEILDDVLVALANVEDPAQRAAMAVDLVGKAGNRIDWSKVNAINDPFKEEQIQQLAKYRAAIDSIAASVENKLIEAFGRLAIYIQQSFDEVERREKELNARGLTARPPTLPDQTPLSRPPSGTKLPDFFQRRLTDEEKRYLEQKKAIDEENKRLAAQARARAMEQQRAVRGGAGGLSSESDKQKAANEAGRETLRTLELQTSQLSKTNEQALKYQNAINGTIGLQKLQADVERSNLAIENDRFNKVQQLEAQIARENAVKDRSKAITNKITGELREQIDLVNQQAAAMKRAKEEEIMLLEKQRNIQADIALLNQQMMQALELNQLAAQNELIGLYGDELRLKQGLLSIEQERQRVVEAANARLRQLGKDATDEDRRRTQQEIDNAQNAANKKVEILKNQIEREKAVQNDAAAGAGQAIDNILKSITPFQVAQEQTNLLFQRMGEGLDEFVKTGKLNFKNFALSLIRDMMLVQIKAQAMNWLGNLLKGGGLFGGSIIPGFLAEGGPATAGKPYIVGEEGPELFIPKGSGTVIPNKETMGNGSRNVGVGGAAQVINNYITNNISAVDAKSVAQLFAENRKTLLGTVELARKELPYANR